MKNSRLTTLLFLAAPLAALAQVTVFNDTFVNGSTTNQVSVPGGTPTASSTSYDMASSKTATNSPAAGHLKIGLSAATGSGFFEVQALFTGTPVTLVTVGDYISLTYTFTNTQNVLSGGDKNTSGLFTGLYYSGGTPPVAGNLANAGLNTTAGSSYASGNCANWQGYVLNIQPSSGTIGTYTRPMQNPATGTTSGNQELIGNGFGGGTYTNPPGFSFGGAPASTVTLTAGAQYTNTLTIALTAAGTLTFINNLYDSSGNILAGLTNSASTTNVLTQAFDGLCIGVRNSSSSSLNPIIDIAQITVTKSIFGSPGPSFTVSGSSNACPGTPYSVYLSGSVTTNVYFLLTNGVYDGAVAPQTGNNSQLTFGPITVVGTNTVLASNTISSFTGLMSGDSVFAVLPGPTITAQPASATVASGYAAIFTVAATGGGLTYQWFTNGVALTDGGNISGSQSNTLTIFPATTTVPLAKGYYAVISNPCGLTTNSITNSLTIGSPANLFWIANNPTTNWDLATTANWSASSGGTANKVFNSGDNVIFDDYSLNQTVNLVGSVDPSSINETSGSGYTFTGSGTIFGPGALVMNGSGTLTISNANSYTGGTTIYNGDVNIKNSAQQALGTGPVTLAGGTLEIGIASGASSAGLSNINVTANSTLQVDATGTYAFNVQNVLTGSPSATLTIRNSLNNSTTASRMRVYGIFTNNAPITLATAGNMLEFAPYNPTNGNQVYKGLISGTGGRVNVRSAGPVIFTGANTFNDSGVAANGSGPSYGSGPGSGLYGYSVLLSGGTLGVGSDSSPDFAVYVPEVNSGSGSSPLGTGIFGINTGPSEGGNATLFAYGGAHTIANPILFTTAATNYTLVISGSNNLTLAGTFNLNGADNTGNTNRVIQVDNTGLTTLSGVVGDASLNCGIIKTGNGSLYLDGLNTYAGSTTVSNGLLAGIGIIAGPVVTASGGTISGGDSGAIGTLVINNNLTLGGNALFKVNTSASPSNDVIAVSGVLTNNGTGTLTVSNLGPALVAGLRFVVFSEAVSNGATMTVTGAGATWTNNLAVDGSISVLSVGSPPSTDAHLLTLVVSPAGTLSPVFNSNAVSYVTTETYTNSPITVTPTDFSAYATNQVIYLLTTNHVASGSASGPLALNPNPGVTNVVDVRVTAQDGVTVKDYIVNITRLPSQTQPTLTNSFGGGHLTLNWSLDHLGYVLQSQTNAVAAGLSTNWVNVSAIGGVSPNQTNQVSIPVDDTKDTVFYRLVYP